MNSYIIFLKCLVSYILSSTKQFKAILLRTKVNMYSYVFKFRFEEEIVEFLKESMVS